MICPKCNAELRKSDLGEYGFVILDVCPDCKGSWFDKGELDRLDHSVWTNFEELKFQHKEAGAQRLSCPKCNHDLELVSPVDSPNLVVDRCPSCEGFWLDAGQLEEVDDIATHIDDKKLAHMRHYLKPPDWSALRWLVHCFKTFK